MAAQLAAAPAQADRAFAELRFPMGHFACARYQEGVRIGKGLEGAAQDARQAAHQDRGIGAAGGFQPAIIRYRRAAELSNHRRPDRDVGKGAGEQRDQTGLAFHHDAAAFGPGAGGEIGNHAGEQDLVAHALFGAHQKARALQGSAGPRDQTLFTADAGHLARHFGPRGIVAPALFQITVQQVQNRPVQPRLRVAGFGLDGGIVQCSGLHAVARVAQHVGQVGQRGGVSRMDRQRGAVVEYRRLVLALFAPRRS